MLGKISPSPRRFRCRCEQCVAGRVASPQARLEEVNNRVAINVGRSLLSILKSLIVNFRLPGWCESICGCSVFARCVSFKESKAWNDEN